MPVEIFVKLTGREKGSFVYAKRLRTPVFCVCAVFELCSQKAGNVGTPL